MGILASTAVIIKHYQITKGRLTIAFDGQSALNEAAGEWPLSIDQPCFDLLQEIRNRVKSLPIDITWRWVEGHQKEKGRRHLDWWGKRNEDVDTLAKAFLKRCKTKANPRPNIPIQLLYEPWALYVHGQKLSYISKKDLYRTLYAPRTHAYWETRHDIKIPSCGDIDWEVSRLAGNKLPQGLKRWKAKFISGCIGVGHALLYRRHQDHANCPPCGHHLEKSSHVLLCPDRKAKQLFEKKLQGPIKKSLKKLKTHPTLHEAFIRVLSHWRVGRRIKPSDFTRLDGIRDAMKDQETIGWTNFFLGRWSPKWQVIQAKHYKRISSKKSPRRWAAAVIHRLFLVAWDMWQYCNNRLHGKAGTKTLARHLRYDTRIEEEMIAGFAELPPHSRHLIRNRTLFSLKNMELHPKKHWLESVRLARKEYAAPVPPSREQEYTRRIMRLFLNHTS